MTNDKSILNFKHKGLLYRIKFDGAILKWESTALLRMISLGQFCGSFEVPVNWIFHYNIKYRFPCFQLMVIKLVRTIYYRKETRQKRKKVIALKGINVLWLNPKTKRKLLKLLELCKEKNNDAQHVQWYTPLADAHQGMRA